MREREKATHRIEQNTEVKRKPHAYINEKEVRVIQAKEWLTLKEDSLLLNVKPFKLRWWTSAGKVKSKKVGKKHAIWKAYLIKIP